MLKGKAHRYPIGTVRVHGGVRKVKTVRGWVPVEREKAGEARLGNIPVSEGFLLHTLQPFIDVGLENKNTKSSV